MHRLYKIALIMLLCSTMFAGEVSDSVTFFTEQPAPSGFTSWSFFWSMPDIDPDAALEFIVLQPDGEEYYRLVIPGTVSTGQEMRSDFWEGFAGGDPEVFFGHDIEFMFCVDRGNIKFPDDVLFRFEFISTIDAVR